MRLKGDFGGFGGERDEHLRGVGRALTAPCPRALCWKRLSFKFILKF
jgi:hypothetical protein